MNESQLYDLFNLYYKNAESDRKAGNIRACKNNLIKASEALLKLAKLSSGNMKAIRLDRAKNLLEIANGMKDNQPEVNIDKIDAPYKEAGRAASTSEDEEGLTSFEAVSVPDISFDDVAGLDEVKESVKDRILLPMQYPEYYRKCNLKAGGGILMYGLPGTGKTMIAKAIAHEVGANFYQVKCSDIVSKWFGEAEKNIQKLFLTARKNDRAVIFFDEFEAIGVKRGGNSTVMNRIVPELLAQIQGFEDSDCLLLIMAATNRPWDIDSALLRPGRFNELILVPLPDLQARTKLFEMRLKGMKMGNVTIGEMADATNGYNGADIGEFCDRLKNAVVKEMISRGSDELVAITREQYEKVKREVKSSVLKSDVAALEKFEQSIGNKE